MCCSTASYSRAIAAGELTQLEWVDRCAHELHVDGVDFDTRFFPRTDDEYLAQLKKLCADRCLTVVCVASAIEIGGDDVDAVLESFLPWIGHALALGAPLLRFRGGRVVGSPGVAWREFIRALKAACAEAKRHNVTLALEAGDVGALVAAPSEMRRAFKECDSAWLRLAMRGSDLTGSSGDEWRGLLEDTVVATTRSGDERECGALQEAGFRGFVSLCYEGEQAEAGAVPAIFAALVRSSGRL